MSGEKLKEALEYSVQQYVESQYNGKFLQMSGLRVIYDMSYAPGCRVKSVEVRNLQSSYDKLDEKKEYNVIITKHLYDKTDGFTMFNVSVRESFTFFLILHV